MPESSAWVMRLPGAVGAPRIRLICIAYAGGSPEIFRPWGHGLGTDVELLALVLPGHGRRIRERPYQDWDRLAGDGMKALSPLLSEPHAFYGHSFGGRLAYELTHRAEAAYPGLTARLFVSGCRTPDRPQGSPLMHRLPDTSFREALRSMAGTPPAVLDNSQLMARLLPVIRAEIRLAELWADWHPAGVHAPVTAIYGRSDCVDGVEDMRGWPAFSRAGGELVETAGGHFFLDTHREELVGVIAARLGESDVGRT